MPDKPADPPGFGWREPRWRQSDEKPSAAKERDRRFRDKEAPRQRGAVDGPSVGDDEEAEDTP